MTTDIASGKAFKRSRPTEAVVSEIIRLLKTEALKPGDQIPTEGTMASALGVSRTSVREAIKGLEASGLLRIEHGKGTFVRRSVPPRAMQTPLYTMLLLGEIDPTHLVESRMLIESQVTRLAAGRIEHEELAALGRLLSEMESTIDPEGFLTLDREFHLTIARSAQNPILYQVVDAIRNVTPSVWFASASAPTRLSDTNREHRQIFDALKRGDDGGAERAVLDHLEATRLRVSQRPQDRS